MTSELRTIRQQMQSDFRTVMTALGVQRDAMSGAFRHISEKMQDVDRALSAQKDALAEFADRTNARFEEIVSVVEGLEVWRSSVEERLDALERKQAG